MPESPLDSKVIKPVNPKGNQPWILIGRTDAVSEVPILWPPDAKHPFTGKDHDIRKDWGQEEKGTTENEMVEKYHCLSGHKFVKIPGDGEGQGSLVCCSPRCHKESTQLSDWTTAALCFRFLSHMVITEYWAGFPVLNSRLSVTCFIYQFSSVTQSCPTLCDPWITARQASLSITNSQSLPKLTSTDSVMPSNHLILCCSLLLLPSIFPSIRVFSNESALHIRWPKYWSFSFRISPTNEHPELISFRMDWLDLLAVQGTPKSLLQHHSSKASVLLQSAFFIVQLSHPHMATGKTSLG